MEGVSYYFTMFFITGAIYFAFFRVIMMSVVLFNDGKGQRAITNIVLSFITLWYINYVLSPLPPGTTIAEVHDQDGAIVDYTLITEAETSWYEFADVIKQVPTGNEMPEISAGQHVEVWKIKNVSLFDIKMVCKSGCKTQSKVEFSMRYPNKWMSVVSWFD